MSLLFPPKVALVLPLKPCSLPWQVSVVTVRQYVVAKVRTFAEMTKKMPRLFTLWAFFPFELFILSFWQSSVSGIQSG